MPIRTECKNLYPKNWRDIVDAVRDRSGDFCEWCGAKNHKPHPVTGSYVVLTTAHLDHDPRNCAMDNLAHLCQKCHNTYDAQHRANGIKARREQSDGQRMLIE